MITEFKDYLHLMASYEWLLLLNNIYNMPKLIYSIQQDWLTSIAPKRTNRYQENSSYYESQ